MKNSYFTIAIFISSLPLFSQIIKPSDKGLKVFAPWEMILSSTGQRVTMYYGEYGDDPVPGDYDGDGITDLAVWRHFRRPEYKGPYSKWHIRFSSTDRDTIIDIDFGIIENDHAIPADYDGDGKTDIAFFRDTDNKWYIKQSSNGQIVNKTFDPTPNDSNNDDYVWEFYLDWNFWSWWPIAADFDGDGKADVGAFHPMWAQWKFQRSSDGVILAPVFGKPGDAPKGWIYDLPVPADNNGDGRAEQATWRPLDKKWEVRNQPALTDTIGTGLEIPAPGDYDGDGKFDKCIFVREPRVKFTPISQQVIPRPQGSWDYDYQFNMYNDNGTYRSVWCGLSPTGRLDAVWYSESTTSPITGFSTPKVVDDGGCDCGMVKVPGTMNNRCGGNPVYLLYYEGDNHDPTPGAPWNGNLGNRILLKYSCDAQTWTRVPGQVLSLPTNMPEKYGKGHPQAYLMNGKVILTAYEDTYTVSPGSLLSVSDDGEHFTEVENTGYGLGGKIRLVEDANVFMGTGALGDEYDIDEFYFFRKDFAAKRKDAWFRSNQYYHVKHLTKIPEYKPCSWGSGIGSDMLGVIKGNSTYIYPAIWDQRLINGTNRYACDRRDSGGILDPRIYAVKTDFLMKKTGCVGNMYSSCKTGACSGLRQRTCMSDTAWGGWTSCVISDKQAPVFLTCPHDTSFIYTTNAYTYSTPAASDNCVYTVTQTTGLGSGAVFPVGVTTETYVATDGNNNTDTCKFNVTVLVNPCQPDLEPPVFTFCPNDTIITDTVIVFNYPSPQATDNCIETISLVTGLGSGQHFPKGITTETYVAKDGANNTDTCRFIIHVIGSTSIHQKKGQANYFSVFPNPTSELLNIRPEAANTTEVKVEIYSIEAVPLFEQTYSATSNNISCSLKDLAPGFYFIKITGNNVSEMHKLQLIK